MQTLGFSRMFLTLLDEAMSAMTSLSSREVANISLGVTLGTPSGSTVASQHSPAFPASVLTASLIFIPFNDPYPSSYAALGWSCWS